jgi:phosphopantothenoylcysteine synthetase/decarboxylase
MGVIAARTLSLIVCGAGPAPRAGILVRLARAAGWRVNVIASGAALAMIDVAGLERDAGSALRTDYSAYVGRSGPRSSAADAVIIAPATYNTVNKLALGINDTYPLNVASEAIGQGTPTAVLPFVNTALAARRPFQAAVEALRSEGVHVLFGPGERVPHPPGAGSRHLHEFPWHRPLEIVEQALDR